MRIDFKILLNTFKILQGLAPKYLQDFVSVLPASCYSLRRNNSGVLLSRPQIKTKKTMGDLSFMVSASMLWNSLPASVRSINIIETFKCAIGTFEFRKAFLHTN